MGAARGPEGRGAEVTPRISFFEEQARRRTQARLWSGVAAAVLGLLGWVLGFLIALSLVVYGFLLQAVLPRWLEWPLDFVLPQDQLEFGPLAIAGVLFAFGLWVVVRVVFARDSSAGLLQRLQARPPNLLDAEEQQLRNIVEEMAIAATVPPPQLRLFDGECVNAAALGQGPESATLLVSRRLLDTLDRDETQGVLGHLMANIVNGDLRLTAGMLRLFLALGLAVTLLDLPFSARARRALRDLLRYAGRRPMAAASGALTAADHAAESDVTARLTAGLQPEGLQCLITFMQRFIGEEHGGFRRWIGGLLLFPLLPLCLLRLGAGLAYGFISLFLLAPLLALILRARRHLADAAAVQLTRHPDGLACALVHLARIEHAVPEASWAEILFIVGGRTTTRPDDTAAKRHNFVYDLHPPLNSRIIRLKRLGATRVAWHDRPDYGPWGLITALALFIGGVGVFVLVALTSE